MELTNTLRHWMGEDLITHLGTEDYEDQDVPDDDVWLDRRGMTKYHTGSGRFRMPVAKVAISIDEHILREIDRWVAAGEYPNRSQVMQAAIAVLKEQRARRGTLLEELAKLDPAEERALADEFLAAETTWPAS